MPNSLTAAGLTTQTQTELLNFYTTNYQNIYGADIDLSSNTQDGQTINIDVQTQIDLLNFMTNIYNSFDPDNAVGVQLDQRCAINGVQRQSGTYSETDITVVLTQQLTLYGLDQNVQQVFTISDNTGNQWFLQETQNNVGPGTVVYKFRAAIVGAQITIPDTINVIVTVILGVSQVNNPTGQSIVGLNEETDASLRLRRAISVAISSQGYFQGLLAALENINGIVSALVYENITNVTDSNGVPGHSIWVIVDGTPVILPQPAWSSTTSYSYGQIVTFAGVNYISWRNNNLNNAVSNTFYWGVYNPVAQAIYNKRNAGCGMYGETDYLVTQIDGSFFNVTWDQVEEQNLFISFTATSIDGINQPDIAGIKDYLVENYKFSVNEEININQMATLVQAADSNTLVTNAGLSLSLTQIATLSGVAASGVFKFNYNNVASANINWNDSVGTIQSKVRSITGLAAAVVTGSIASQTLTIALNVDSALSLLTVTDNTLATSGPVAITFAFNEGYTNTLETSQKKNKFVLSEDNIIILPMILSPSATSVPVSTTKQFTGLGGYGPYVYSMQANPSGGSFVGAGAQTGLYTAGATPGTDIAKVTDAFGNTATATITVF